MALHTITIMNPFFITPGRFYTYRYFLLIALFLFVVNAVASAQGPDTATYRQGARAFRGAAAVVPLAAEPAAKLIVDAPLADQLALGRVVVQYRTENLRIAPVFGPAALEVSPRIGHLHITVNAGPWRWVDTSNEPIIINGLPPGLQHLTIELVGPTHKRLDGITISFTIPAKKSLGTQAH
jgi:hypothetical protein